MKTIQALKAITVGNQVIIIRKAVTHPHTFGVAISSIGIFFLNEGWRPVLYRSVS